MDVAKQYLNVPSRYISDVKDIGDSTLCFHGHAAAEIVRAHVTDATWTAAFLQAIISEKNVVKCFGVCSDNAATCGIVLGRTLCSLWDVLCLQDLQPPPLDWRIQLVLDSAEALDYVHSHQIVHGLVTPASFRFSLPTSGCVLQISDFRNARSTTTAARGTKQEQPGTVPLRAQGSSTTPLIDELVYSVPELRQPLPGTPPRITYQSDVYGWALLAWHILAWRKDVDFDVSDVENVRERITGLSEECGDELKSLLLRCLVRDPAERPWSGAELLALLQPALPPYAATSPIPPFLLDIARRSGESAHPGLVPVEAKKTAHCPPLKAWGVEAAVMVESCPVCYTEGVPGVSMHPHYTNDDVVCYSCALAWFRDETGRFSGIPCPCCNSMEADKLVPPAVISHVAAWSRSAAAMAAGARPFTDEPLLRAWCLSSPLLETAVRTEDTAMAQLKCMKRCPSCRTPIIRPRGHGCHHIKPSSRDGKGCSVCGVHFCFNCLVIHPTGGPYYPCANGCSTWCDSACTCEDCPDCEVTQRDFQQGCSTCTGSEYCRVCRRAQGTPLSATIALLNEAANSRQAVEAFESCLRVLRTDLNAADRAMFSEAAIACALRFVEHLDVATAAVLVASRAHLSDENAAGLGFATIAVSTSRYHLASQEYLKTALPLVVQACIAMQPARLRPEGIRDTPSIGTLLHALDTSQVTDTDGPRVTMNGELYEVVCSAWQHHMGNSALRRQ